MNISIIGLGLIGGSVGLSLKKKKYNGTVIYGVDNNAEHAEAALRLGLIDKIITLQEAIAESQVIVVATPVNTLYDIITYLLDNISAQTVVIDMGSTKREICSRLRQHPHRGQWVAAHPMAGTENSGPQAAVENLFDGQKTIICEHNLSADFALNTALSIFHKLNMNVLFYSDAAEHDLHAAYVSHISHISSFTLALTVLDVEKSHKHLLDMAGGGLQSTVRLAKSTAQTWLPIFQENKENLLYAIESYIHHLNEFKEALSENDNNKVTQLIEKSNSIIQLLEQRQR